MRRLVAALACRVQGSRLYGKPLQNLDIEGKTTILDHMINLLQTLPEIQSIVLGIAEGAANEPFVELAKRRKIDFIRGNERDVLYRLILCGRKGEGTDLFRVTTESPFCYFDRVNTAWQQHIQNANDVTTIAGVPVGCDFEIYKLEALEKSHALGNERHRSEYCSLYVREHRSEFKIQVLEVPSPLRRPELRLTVDYPEDLLLCRQVYGHLKHKAPRLPLQEIIQFLDDHPEIRSLVTPYEDPTPTW